MVFRIIIGLSILILGAVTSVADDGRRDQMPPSRINVDRRIATEPDYAESPRYCLLIFGPEGRIRVWMVEDGDRLFVDRNANGDLSDDGEAATGHDHARFRSTFEYQVGELRFADGGIDISRLVVWRSRSRENGTETNYSVLVTINGVAQSGGWKPIFAETPAEASVLHFGGRLQPRPYRRKSLRLFPRDQELSIAFSTPGLGEQYPVSLENDAAPEDVRPTLTIDWPSSSSSRVRTYHKLTQRQCYWEFTETIAAPKDATTGTAYIGASFPTDLPIVMETHGFEMEVIDRDKKRLRQRWIQP